MNGEERGMKRHKVIFGLVVTLAQSALATFSYFMWGLDWLVFFFIAMALIDGLITIYSWRKG